MPPSAVLGPAALAEGAEPDVWPRAGADPASGSAALPRDGNAKFCAEVVDERRRPNPCSGRMSGTHDMCVHPQIPRHTSSGDGDGGANSSFGGAFPPRPLVSKLPEDCEPGSDPFLFAAVPRSFSFASLKLNALSDLVQFFFSSGVDGSAGSPVRHDS